MKHYAYIAVIIALIGFVKWYSDRQYQAGVDNATAKYEKALRSAENRSEKIRTKSQVEINKITQLWLDKKQEVEFEYEKIKKRLADYVVDNRSCNLARGAVGLLNESRDPEQLQADFHPALTDAEASEPSTVSEREVVEQLIRDSGTYTKVATQLVALQGAVKELDCVVH